MRPAGRQLIALTNRSRLYSVQRTRAIATPIGANPFMPALAGSAFGFDFNPTVDRIRVVSGSGQNLRLTIQAPPNDGVLMTVGNLGVNLSGPLGFGISAGDGKTYVLAHRPGTDRSRLFTINLAKGTARKLGIVRRAPDLVAFATLSKRLRRGDAGRGIAPPAPPGAGAGPVGA